MPGLLRNISILKRCSNLYRGDRLKEIPINPHHCTYVLAICHHPGISQEELAKHICIDKSGVARHLAVLEEQGYVKRIPSEKDKRCLLVYPTTKMEEILPKVRQATKDWNDYLAEGLSEEELELFRSLLQRVTDRAKNYADRREETDTL